jgi:hypothetical protein
MLLAVWYEVAEMLPIVAAESLQSGSNAVPMSPVSIANAAG